MDDFNLLSQDEEPKATPDQTQEAPAENKPAAEPNVDVEFEKAKKKKSPFKTVLIVVGLLIVIGVVVFSQYGDKFLGFVSIGPNVSVSSNVATDNVATVIDDSTNNSAAVAIADDYASNVGDNVQNVADVLDNTDSTTNSAVVDDYVSNVGDNVQNVASVIENSDACPVPTNDRHTTYNNNQPVTGCICRLDEDTNGILTGTYATGTESNLDCKPLTCDLTQQEAAALVSSESSLSYIHTFPELRAYLSDYENSAFYQANCLVDTAAQEAFVFAVDIIVAQIEADAAIALQEKDNTISSITDCASLTAAGAAYNLSSTAALEANADYQQLVADIGTVSSDTDYADFMTDINSSKDTADVAQLAAQADAAEAAGALQVKQDECDVTDAAAAQAIADAAAAQAVVDAAAAQAVADAAAAQDAQGDVVDTLSCDEIDYALSKAYHEEDWDAYEAALADYKKSSKKCYSYCEETFYYSIFNISSRLVEEAVGYYSDSQCDSCSWSLSLADYAAEFQSDQNEFTSEDEEILRDGLIKKAIDNCTHNSYSDFMNKLQSAYDSSDWFTDEDKLDTSLATNRGLASLFPTAYAASGDFSPEVEAVIEDIYEEEVPEVETSTPECRTLQIVRPAEAVVGQPTVTIPKTGYINEELEIAVDADANAVMAYRYKSSKGTITFDNHGNILDTLATSVLMNGGNGPDGDIVTVWALDGAGTGIQSCHDAFYVAPTVPVDPVVVATTVTSTPVAPVAAVAPVAPVAPAQIVQVVPQYTPQPLHGAAMPPRVTENGPGVLIYLAGAGLGSYIVGRRRKKN